MLRAPESNQQADSNEPAIKSRSSEGHGQGYLNQGRIDFQWKEINDEISWAGKWKWATFKQYW